ncbi:MAG: LON peptidase substrate-binding domain-containing protein [Candidatus Kapabacteria bacterium]|nr:LON peptidase substrate-binding domain-containing protein [Ignavibacteriota bacterium]MCW5886130.1 LON peptidase substrate-binding domain-containing protein [Candidatus Kapabacteria bacterium]
MIKIGLFPLNLIMFPEAMYPLHIFEERYKLLINSCYASGLEFGINFINSSGINEIGCTAIVSEVLKKYSDGKMDIIVQGISRYRIMKLKEGEELYYTAEVEPFADDDFEIDKKILDEAVRMYNKIIEGITSLKIDKINPDKLPVKYPSFLIAQKAGMTAEQKQSLLEIRSENLRLKTISNHLRKVQPMIKRAEVISNIVKNDGYLNPWELGK